MGKVEKDVQTEAQETTTALQVNTGDLMAMENLGCYYSVKATTKAEKVKLFNAINNPDKRLADYINMTIKVKDILVEMVELEQTDDNDEPKLDVMGEPIKVKAPRIILIDENGESYQCVSVGVFSALKKIIALFGEPTWSEPVEIKVKQVSKKERKMLTIELI